MNARDKKDLESACNAICKMWRDNHKDNDSWYRREYRQGLYDALNALQYFRLIKDFRMEGVTLHEGLRPGPRRFVPTGKKVRVS